MKSHKSVKKIVKSHIGLKMGTIMIFVTLLIGIIFALTFSNKEKSEM